jgi:hypothetical protein
MKRKNESEQDFLTISNNGCCEDYINSCIWISIQHYLIHVKNIQISVSKIREIAHFPGNNFDDFDFNNEDHMKCMQSFLKGQHLSLIFYFVKEEDNRLTLSYLTDDHIYGENIIPIVSSGNHFELLISGTDNIESIDIGNKFIFDNGQYIDLSKYDLDTIKENLNHYNFIDSEHTKLKLKTYYTTRKIYKLKKKVQDRENEFIQMVSKYEEIEIKVKDMKDESKQGYDIDIRRDINKNVNKYNKLVEESSYLYNNIRIKKEKIITYSKKVKSKREQITKIKENKEKIHKMFLKS